MQEVKKASKSAIWKFVEVLTARAEIIAMLVLVSLAAFGIIALN